MALIGTRFLVLSMLVAVGCGGTTVDQRPGVGHGGQAGEGTGGRGGEPEVGTGGRGDGGDGGRSTGGRVASGGIGAGGAGGSGTGGSGGKSTIVEIHRAKGEQCDNERAVSVPPKLPDGQQDGGGTWPYFCTSDAQCTEGKNGRCSGNGHDGWACTYDECFTDSDCQLRGMMRYAVCSCGGNGRSDNTICLYGGNCIVDADCGPPGKGFCSPSGGSCNNSGNTLAYWCHKPEDECTNAADCPNGSCTYLPVVGHYRCVMTTACPVG